MGFESEGGGGGFVIGIAKVLPIIDVQVNKKSCRLRMGAYRDGVKSKGDKIGMGV